MGEEKKVGVGVGIVLVRDGKVLLGKRRRAHGESSWGFPGGHLEFNELLETCAKREVKEETGLEIGDIKPVSFTNDIFELEGKHYITLFVVANDVKGEPNAMEPDKCEKWEWFNWEDLPSPLFVPIQNLLKQGFNLNKFVEVKPR